MTDELERYVSYIKIVLYEQNNATIGKSDLQSLENRVE